MTAEIQALLGEVDELKSKEAALKSEKQRHSEQMTQPMATSPTMARNDLEDHRMAWRTNYSY